MSRHRTIPAFVGVNALRDWRRSGESRRGRVEDASSPTRRALRSGRLTARPLLALLLGLPLAAPTSRLGAQDSVPVAVGARVRVSMSASSATRTTLGGGVAAARGGPRLLVGTLAAADTAAVLIAPERGAPALVPLAAVSRLDVSRGRGFCSGGMRRIGCVVGGGAAGLLVGGLVGGAVGKATEPHDCYECYDVLAGIVVGGLTGATAGTILGAVVGRERWQRVPLRQR